MLFPLFPVATAATAAILLILQQVLLMTVGIHRGGAKIGVGAGGDIALERKIRRHGNLAENSAIFLIGLGLLEMTDPATAPFVALALAFLVARLLHIVAFASEAGSHLAPGSKFFPALRSIGAISTALLGIGAGIWLLVRIWPEFGL